MSKSKAFTFAEVLLSLLVLTSSVYVFSKLQFKSIFRTEKSTQEVERVFFVKKYLYKLYLSPPAKNKKTIKKTITEPEVVITANRQDIDPKKSSLKKLSKKLEIIWSKGSWESGPDKREIKMISFVTKNKPDKK